MIRPYKIEDWPQVVEVYEEALNAVFGKDGIASKYPVDLQKSMFYRLKEENIAVGIVVGYDENIDGYILAQQYAPGVCAIDEIYFRPNLRGTALFGRAADAFENLARERGYKYILAGSWASHSYLRKLIGRKGYEEMTVISYKEL